MKSLDVLMPAKGMDLIEDQISARLPLHRLWLEPNPDLWLAEWAPQIRAIAMTGGHAPLDEAYMRQFPKLEIISSFGVGYDNIDAKAAARLGVTVTNTPGVLDDEVADTTLGLMIMTVRQLPQSERYLRAGQWATKGNFPLSPSLRGRTVGILGLGRIGKAIATRVSAFGLDVVYHGRHAQADVALSLLSLADRHGQGVRRSDRGRARRPRDAPHRQRRSVRGARSRWRPDQYRARLVGRRERADRGAAEQDNFGRGTRRFRERAQRAARAHCAREHSAPAARRLGVGKDAPGDGRMRRLERVRLGRRQAASSLRCPRRRGGGSGRNTVRTPSFEGSIIARTRAQRGDATGIVPSLVVRTAHIGAVREPMYEWAVK